MSASEIAIRVEGLGKRYRIGESGRDHQTFRERLSEIASAPLRRVRGESRPEEDRDFWALRDVSFEVRRGEVLGVIGRNGAGKSTLLKILARITEPTEGCAEIRGRVGSLLEVGTGFHPELTGRDNIYLNGAILGMKRAEIERRFDEIVAFAEVDRFIDTPVKRYSSGMYLRLAFAVAAHLEPEILLVDEVLAVGDAAFQKKCLGKMGDVASEGRTVLFVSHSMAAIAAMCERVLLVSDGHLASDGVAEVTIDQYLAGSTPVPEVHRGPSIATEAGQRLDCLSVEIESPDGRGGFVPGVGEPFTFLIGLRSSRTVGAVSAGLEVANAAGVSILNLRSDAMNADLGRCLEGDELSIRCATAGLPLFPGTYFLNAWFAERGGKRLKESQVKFEIVSKGVLQSEQKLQPGRGLVLLDSEWTVQVAREEVRA